MAQKHVIRIRAVDGKPRDWKALHAELGGQTFIRIYPPRKDVEPRNVEFILTADSAKQLDVLKERLVEAGVEVMNGGDTTYDPPASSRPLNTQARGQGGFLQRGGQPRPSEPQRRSENQQRSGASQGQQAAPRNNAQPLPGKPFGFVALPNDLTTAPPVWLDGTSSVGRLSGEIRFELETLTPLLVGWERGQAGDKEADWQLPENLPNVGRLEDKKPVLCPLRAPWGTRPVIIPGETLKGLLRHELGALLGAPMERVAERYYSYRPNASHPDDSQGRVLEPRLARVISNTNVPVGEAQFFVPVVVDVLRFTTRNAQTYLPRRVRGRDVQPSSTSERYNGGLGLPDAIVPEELRKPERTHLDLRNVQVDKRGEKPSQPVIAQYVATVAHLLERNDGHFSARHPQVGHDQSKQQMALDAVRAKAALAFQPGDLIWVEWDTEKECIVSLGWHYYYRWAYTDSLRQTGGRLERYGLFPLSAERELERSDDDPHREPKGLSAVRRLFGYTGDNEGSAGIGQGDHTQLMGRLFPNAALEVVGDDETDEHRFLKPTFLRELGMPRPSAVEHYLKQPDYPNPRGRTDQAKLLTYGDAAGYDEPGELAGRKFYLDRRDAYGPDGNGLVPGPAEDRSDTNKQNERSTLALEASMPGRRFRFTVRFRDLDASELAAVLIALCPDQFKNILGGSHADGYCSKLGYARPLGWGSVRIEAKQLLWLVESAEAPTLTPELDLAGWVSENHVKPAPQDEWVAIHRRNHPNATDYPRGRARDGTDNIYTFHTTLRAEHSRARRYRQRSKS